MCMHFFWLVIAVNEIADLGMIFDSIMGFQAHIIEKISVLVGNYYQLNGNINRTSYLKSLRNN